MLFRSVSQSRYLPAYTNGNTLSQLSTNYNKYKNQQLQLHHQYPTGNHHDHHHHKQKQLSISKSHPLLPHRTLHKHQHQTNHTKIHQHQTQTQPTIQPTYTNGNTLSQLSTTKRQQHNTTTYQRNPTLEITKNSNMNEDNYNNKLKPNLPSNPHTPMAPHLLNTTLPTTHHTTYYDNM